MVRQKPNKDFREREIRIHKDVLEILRTRTDFVPDGIKHDQSANEFQLFEVLTTRLMSLIETDFEWTVTSLRNDQGVDFFGKKPLLAIPGFGGASYWVIAGQCKTNWRIQDTLPSDLFDLVESQQPHKVVVVFMTTLSQKRIADAQRKFRGMNHRECYFLGLQDMVRLMRMYYQDVLPLLSKTLDAEKEAVLRGFLLEAQEPHSDDVTIRIHKPRSALAGTPFVVQVDVESVLLCKQLVKVRWRFPSDAMLIRPTDLLAASGYALGAEARFASRFGMKIVTHAVGEVDLGELVFEIDGLEVKTVSLGTITTIDQYHPIFFWPPYQVHREGFLQLFEEMQAGAPQGVAITGQGGAGKTRLCQELGYLAEQQGAELISISHPQDLAHPYRIFGLLVQQLAGLPAWVVDPQQAIENHIRSSSAELYQRARGTIAAIFSGDSETGVFDREAMVQVLALLLLERTRTRSYLLHFSDLHWASAETLAVLGESLQRLKRNAGNYRAPVFFLFEGRVQTTVQHESASAKVDSSSRPRRSTAIFEGFVQKHGLERREIRPLTSVESLAFLTHLFENSQSSERRIPDWLIPHQQILIKEIARYGAGNPFHMVEQIKLLRHEGAVTRNQRTGLIHLIVRPKANYQVPTSVRELVSLRLAFLKDTLPQLALLIKAVGLVKDRIELGLFRELRRSLAQSVDDAVIQEIEILNIGDSEVGFRHENYFRVVRDAPLAAAERRKLTRIYLRWFRKTNVNTAERLYEEALVNMLCDGVALAHIKRLLGDSLKKAEAAHQYQLAIQVVRKTLETLSGESDGNMNSYEADVLTKVALRTKLGAFSLDVQDWALGAQQYEAAISDINEYLNMTTTIPAASRAKFSFAKTSAMLGLANCQTDLGRSYMSIQLLGSAKEICEAYFKTGIKKSLEQWAVLYSDILNRLGEANWMDGNYDASLRWLEEAIANVEGRIRNANIQRLRLHINLLDYGAVLLHRDPAKAVETLKKSVSLIPPQGWSPRYRILSATTLFVGEVVHRYLSDGGKSDAILRFLEEQAIPQFEADFQRAEFYGFKQEQVAAGLMMAICLSLLDQDAAIRWYMETIEIGFQSNNLESLWRVHLNLAQYLTEHENREAGIFHAGQALQLLLTDLERRKPEEQTWKYRHLLRPFTRLAELLREAPSAISPEVSAFLAQVPDLPAESYLGSNYFRDKIIFLKDGAIEYYPYGG
jgi:tetratricopeptide (TPR) repeat protein